MRFMQQDLFELASVSVFKMTCANPANFSMSVKFLSESYQGSYPDEPNLRNDFIAGSNAVAEMAKQLISDDNYWIAFGNQMQFCIKNYTPEGNPKKKRLFNGAWFNYDRIYSPNRIRDLKVHLLAFHRHSSNGLIPIAPPSSS